MHTKKLWQNINWGFNGYLFVPISPGTPSRREIIQRVMHDTIAAAVVHEEVFGERMSLDKLLNLMPDGTNVLFGLALMGDLQRTSTVVE